MELSELKKNLRYLVEKYISDDELSSELHKLIDEPGRPPVKKIMAEVSLSERPGDPSDEVLFKEISFNYL